MRLFWAQFLHHLCVISTVHPTRRETTQFLSHPYILWLVLALISFSTAHPYTQVTYSPIDKDVWTQLHDFLSCDQSSYSERCLSSHSLHLKSDQNACHSLRNTVCPELLHSHRNTFLESIIFAIYLAGHSFLISC